jgi:hypothetical protein
MVLERLLLYVFTTGKPPANPRTGLVQREFDGVGVADIDGTHRREQGGTRTTKTCGGPDEPRVGGLDVVRGQRRAIVEVHTFPEEKGVGLAIRRNLPTVREVWDNGLPTVQRVTADQVIVHTALGPHIGDGPRLVHIKMRWRTQDAIPQHPAMLRMGLTQ